MLQSDKQGFLVGELITSQGDLLHLQQQAMPLWKSLRNDVRNIARFLGARSTNSRPAQPAARGRSKAAAPAARARPATTTARDPKTGRFVATPKTAAPARRQSSERGDPFARAATVLTTAKTSTPAARPPTAAPSERDERGRFRGSGESRPGGRRQPGDGNGAGGEGLLGGLRDRLGGLKTAIDGLANGSEQVDPAVAAVHEVKEVVAPIGRGLFSVFGRNSERAKERKKERWYKRFLDALKPKGAGAAASVAAGSSGLGAMSALGRLAAGVLPMLGMVLTRIFGPIAGIWASFKIGQWIGERVYKWLDESGLLTKVFDAFDSVTSFVSDNFKAVADAVTSTWDKVTSGFAKGVDAISSIPERIGNLLSAIDTGIRKVPIIGDLYAKAADTTKAVVTEAKKGYEAARNPVVVDTPTGKVVQQPAAPTTLAEKAGRAAGAVVKGMADAKDWALGKTSERFESGGRGAGTISTGKGDFGGASYGTYQLSSKAGTLQKFLDASGYADQFKGMKAGTAQFNAQWQKIAREDPTFGDKQHKFIEDTHFNPQMELLKKSGIDLSGRSAAVKDAVWSTSVQFGGQTGLIAKALAGKDAATMSDADIINSIQDYKAKNNDRLFSSSSAAVRVSTADRAETERKSLLALAGASSGTVVASAAPKIPEAPGGLSPVPQKLPEAQTVAMPPQPSAEKERTLQAVVREPIGQDVGDRKIAHIVSGGIAS